MFIYIMVKEGNQMNLFKRIDNYLGEMGPFLLLALGTLILSLIIGLSKP